VAAPGRRHRRASHRRPLAASLGFAGGRARARARTWGGRAPGRISYLLVCVALSRYRWPARGAASEADTTIPGSLGLADPLLTLQIRAADLLSMPCSIGCRCHRPIVGRGAEAILR
jgi:hypothetical protein